jgi:DNA-binding transcriptional MerR regulator
MRIGDLASQTGVTPRMLRYYEEPDPAIPAHTANVAFFHNERVG